MRLSVFLLVLFSLAASPVHAGQSDKLKQVESDLAAKREEQQRVAAKQTDIKNKLHEVQERLTEVTQDVQKHERALLKVRERQDETQKEIDIAQEKLDAQRGSLAQLIMALQRLSRLPSQALMVRPSAPVDTARSYVLLQQVIPNVSKKAQEVKVTLDELAVLSKTFDEQQASLIAEQDKLKEKQAAFQTVIDERRKLLKQTTAEKNKADQNVAALSRQAKDLRDLLNRLAEATPAKPVPALTKGAAIVSSWFKGGNKLPVTGSVTSGYGQTLDGGGVSQGLNISAAGGAIVTAPSAGIVRFAGPFRQYKLLVIIQHPTGEHSLLGGLREVYTRVGDHIGAGEPIGKLSGDSRQTASLYYERRRHGKPIDPRSARG